MPMMQDESKASNIITAKDLQEHANETNPWFVVNGHVYDGTSFLENHPGGGESITLVAGEDASEDFMAIHSMDAKAQLKDFHIGKLEEGGAKAAAEEEEVSTDGPFLNPKRWKKEQVGQQDGNLA